MSAVRVRGFTLVEVLVALMIVALALSALMSSISSTARGSGYLRDKALAQWIAMNRIAEVRLNLQKFGANNDKNEIEFGNRRWRYDTRYFNTDNPNIRRVIVRVWPGSAKEKDAPLAESMSFLGSALAPPGNSDGNWLNPPGGGGNPGGSPVPPGPGSTTPPSHSTPAPSQ